MYSLEIKKLGASPPYHPPIVELCFVDPISSRKHKDIAKSNEAQCKRKLEFKKAVAKKETISNGRTTPVEAEVSLSQANGSIPVTDNDKQEVSLQSTSPKANGRPNLLERDEARNQEISSPSNENEMTPPVTKANYSSPANDSGTEDSDKTATKVAKVAVGTENDGEKVRIC